MIAMGRYLCGSSRSKRTGSEQIFTENISLSEKCFTHCLLWYLLPSLAKISKLDKEMVAWIFFSQYSLSPWSEYKYVSYSTHWRRKNFKGTIYIFPHNIYVNLYNRIPLSCWRILNPPNCSQFAFLETLVSRALDHFLPFLRVFSECSSFWNNFILFSNSPSDTQQQQHGGICNFFQLLLCHRHRVLFVILFVFYYINESL